MNKKSIKLGDKVIVYNNRSEIAQVVEDHGDEEYSCQYLDEKGGLYGNSFMVESDEVEFYDPEFEANRKVQLQARINEAANAFEKAFDALKAVAKEAGSEYIPMEDGLDLSKLESVIEGAGWSSSSLYCS